VEAVAFDVAAFTNLTQDHLDFHARTIARRLTRSRRRHVDCCVASAVSLRGSPGAKIQVVLRQVGERGQSNATASTRAWTRQCSDFHHQMDAASDSARFARREISSASGVVMGFVHDVAAERISEPCRGEPRPAGSNDGALGEPRRRRLAVGPVIPATRKVPRGMSMTASARKRDATRASSTRMTGIPG